MSAKKFEFDVIRDELFAKHRRKIGDAWRHDQVEDALREMWDRCYLHTVKQIWSDAIERLREVTKP